MFFPAAAAPPGAPHVLADLTAVSAAMATLVFRTYGLPGPGFPSPLPSVPPGVSGKERRHDHGLLPANNAVNNP
jgi:hypothetical protein